MATSSNGYVFVQLGDAYIEVSLAGIERGTQLIEAAFYKLGLDKKGVALVDFRLFRAVDGVRGDAIPPLGTGDLLPSSGSMLQAALVPVAFADAGAHPGPFAACARVVAPRALAAALAACHAQLRH